MTWFDDGGNKPPFEPPATQPASWFVHDVTTFKSVRPVGRGYLLTEFRRAPRRGTHKPRWKAVWRWAP